MMMRKRRRRKTKMIQIITPMICPFKTMISFNLESSKVEDNNFIVMNWWIGT